MQAIVYGFANLELMNMLCKQDLVITKSVALENPVAWPIRPSYSAGLSYWMYEADKKYGLKVESIKATGCQCDIGHARRRCFHSFQDRAF